MLWIKLNNKELETKIFTDEQITYDKRRAVLHHGMDRLRNHYIKFIKTNDLELLHKNISPINMKHTFVEGGKLHLRLYMNLNTDIKSDAKLYVTFFFQEKTRLRESIITTIKFGEQVIEIVDRINLNYDEHMTIHAILEKLELNKNLKVLW